MCDKNLVLSLTVLGVGEVREREEERWNAAPLSRHPRILGPRRTPGYISKVLRVCSQLYPALCPQRFL